MGRRGLVDAERLTPDRLQTFLLGVEKTRRSEEVWQLLVDLGRDFGLPFIDYVTASSFRDWRQTLFVRTSYDSRWLGDLNRDPEIENWSYYRMHARDRLTPIAVGLEFLDDGYHIPEKRVALMKTAAEHGMRAGLCIPLRQVTPPRAGMITFFGPHSKREMQAIIHAHGWSLHAAALIGHQRFLTHFSREFRERNQVTDKQIELIRLIGQGLKDKTISDELGISVSAVRQRMQALLSNTGLKSRAELAVLAMRLGVLPDPFDPAEDGIDTFVEMDNAGTRIRPGS